MFQCKDLLALPTMAKAKVISGKSGLHHGIRWAYKAETMDFSKWIHGQELLIISTPVIQSAEFDLLKMIEEAIKHKVTGVLMLVGEDYVSQISKDVLKLSNVEEFPIMIIPGNEVPLVDVFEEMGHAIAYHEKMADDREDLLASIIFGNNIDIHSLMIKSEMIGYDMTPPQQMFVIHFFRSDGVDGKNLHMQREEIQDITRRISLMFTEHHYEVLLSNYSNNLVGMMKREVIADNKIEDVFQEIKEYLIKGKQDWKFNIGVGNSYEQLEDLQKSFQDASKCITAAKKIKKECEILWYNHLGFYNLLLSMNQNDSLQMFCNEVLGDLMQYDQENHTNLMETLKIYVENHCNLQKTSQFLYTHRNTIKYRVQNIEKITKRSFQNSFQVLELYNAMIIFDFLS